MHIDLRNKTAIVTGSSAGIGLAIATGLASCGARVVVTGRHSNGVNAAAATIVDRFGDASAGTFVGDLGNREGCSQLVAAHPSCDILVNNLGTYGRVDFFDTTDDEWLRYFEVNVLSGVRLARAYLGEMARKNWGRVVFVSSESGLSIPADQIHYGVSKTAQLSLARGLAKRMAGTGVTVNSVLPGPTLSDGVARLLETESGAPLEGVVSEYIRKHRPSSILGRGATVEEIANMVVYACSLQASATTGAALRVDGGIVDCI